MVDLLSSKVHSHSSFLGILNRLPGKRRMPQCAIPPRSVADIALVKTARSQDTIALVKHMSEIRGTPNGKDVADLTLIDESRLPCGNMATVQVAVWGRKKLEILKEQVGQVVVFYGILTTLKEGAVMLNHYEPSKCCAAPACAKTTQLQAATAELVRSTNVSQLTKEWVPTNKRKDTSGPQSLACAAFLGLTSDQPDAGIPEVVQLSWLRIDEPAEQSEVQDKSKTRLWYQAHCRDISGSATIGIPQDLLLKLSSCRDMDIFLKQQSMGTLTFPVFCSRFATVSRYATMGTLTSMVSRFATMKKMPFLARTLLHW